MTAGVTGDQLAGHRPQWLGAELAWVAERARAFFVDEVVPHAARFARQGHPDRALFRRAGELGLLGLSVPSHYGGAGATFAADAVLYTELMRAGDCSLNLAVHAIVADYVLNYATEPDRQRWLPRLCSGEWVGAIALTEPGAGSDLQAITTRAVREGDGYLVSGSKTFISHGRLCDLVLLAVRTGSGFGAAGLSLLVAEVSDDTPGFRRGPTMAKLGQHGQDTTQLFFDGLRVPAANLLGQREGRGFRQLMRQLPRERLIAAISAVVAMELAVDYATRHLTEAAQHARTELADCATLARVGRVFLDDCIQRHLRGELDVATAAMAKYWLTDQQCAVVDRCLRLFGSDGCVTGHPIARLAADSRVQRIYAGANEVMKELVAMAL